jgi:acyl-CoA hydrolase
MAMAKTKTPSESYTKTTELVLPNDTNTLNHMMGGRMMHLMDIVGAICAQKHSNRVVVTASVDTLSFRHPIRLGACVTIEAKVTRSFSSSMELHVVAYAEDLQTEVVVKSNEAYFTFVAVDQAGRPIDVPQVMPETEAEKVQYDGAFKRRQLRLLMAGRLKPSEVAELSELLVLHHDDTNAKSKGKQANG